MTVADDDAATWAAGLLALCGPALGGAVVDDAVAQELVAAVARAAGDAAPVRSLAASVPLETLTGSLDLAATLALGRPVLAPGVLDGRRPVTVLVRRSGALLRECVSAMAEALDDGRLLLFAAIGAADDAPAPRLAERLAFHVVEPALCAWSPQAIAEARTRLATVTITDAQIDGLARAALAFGIDSPRAAILAVGAARGVAALSGRQAVTESDLALAGRLAFAHRARQFPAEAEEPPQDTSAPPEDAPAAEPDAQAPQPQNAEVIVEAVRSALPPHLLAEQAAGAGRKSASRTMQSAAARKADGARGRRVGHKRASSLARQRLDILATLRCAAPWQPLRRRTGRADRMVVTRDDFRVARVKQRSEATAIFAVDASGSTAFQRLAEAKGAVETVLADCYVRRDRVALVSFRSKTAEVLLPPTGSLERVRRALAGLPGGGGTPLAAGLDAAYALAAQVRRAGGTPTVIVLTDGRANVTRAGEGNKAKATEEAISAARLFSAERIDAMVIDISPDPQKQARLLAEAMQARYLPMPRAGALDIARPVAQALRARGP